jgi:virginiamycin B lyase
VLSTNTFTEWIVPIRLNYHGFESIAFDSSSRDVYFIEHNSNKIGRLSPDSNTISEWTAPTKSDDLFGITSDFSGNIYFVEHNGNKIGRLSPDSNTITEWTIPTNSSGPTALAFDSSSGSLYFVENNTNKIGRLVLSTNTFTEWPVNKSLLTMYVAPSGNLYFVSGNGTISRLG